MEEKDNQIYVIEVIKRIAQHWKLFIIVSIITFALACAIILPVPRYYVSSVELAPEMNGNMSSGGGGLADLASSVGINLNNGQNIDAIYPDLYPELMQSNDFLINLAGCRVKTNDGKVDTTYYDYLRAFQKKNPLLAPIAAIKKSFTKKEQPQYRSVKKLNIFNLSKDESCVLGKMRDNISCSIDKKTGLINISVKDQDPLVCANISDSAMAQLQDFIIRYRTSKAKNDVKYYSKLTSQAKAEYEKARRLYGYYADANTDVTLQSIKSKEEDLENDMQLKYNAYSAMLTQLQSARAKLQERVPSFTVVKSASVPIKPAGPKRMIFVLIMLVLSWIVTTIYSCRDLYKALFSSIQK